jgi:hypothetical protein
MNLPPPPPVKKTGVIIAPKLSFVKKNHARFFRKGALLPRPPIPLAKARPEFYTCFIREKTFKRNKEAGTWRMLFLK